MILKVIQHLTDEVVKSPHNMVGKISFSSEMLFNQNILESFYRDYSENENSFIQNACIPLFSDFTLSDTFGFILTNESQNSFRQLPKKSTFITIFKCIKEWVVRKGTWPLKKFMEAFELRMEKFIKRKKKKSKFLNEPIDCTNEFIYICSKSKSINSLLFNRS